MNDAGWLRVGGLPTRRRRLLSAAILASVVGLLIPASATGSPPVKTKDTFSFASFVPCAGEYAVVEGTLRTVTVERPDGGYVARQVWTHFHGTGYRDVGGVLVPTGTKWVYSAASGTVFITSTGDGPSFRNHSVLRLTSAGSAPDLRLTALNVADWNPETQRFEYRVQKFTLTCD